MANTTFKARFKQLIAPLSSWTTGDKKDFKILPGEIAFATAAIAGVESGEEPVVLFKVNYTDAEATWGNLEYSAYANAQDVHAWAKQAGITVEDNGTGTVISTIKWENDKLIVGRRGLTNDDLAGLTIGNALHADASTKVDNAFTVIGKAFDGSTAVSITADEVYEAIKDKDENTTYTLTGADNKLVLTPSEGEADEITVEGTGIASVSVSENKITVHVDEVASAPEVAHSLTILDKPAFNGSADVTVTADDIYGAIQASIEDTKVDEAARADAAGKVDNKLTVFGKEFDGSAAQTVQYSDIEAQVKASARAELTGDISTAEANAKAYTDEMKDAILGEGIKDTFDTLVEIQSWIEGDGVNATELTEAIAEEARLRGEADTALDGRLDVIEAKPAMGIGAGDIVNWNKEIGALELAQAKLDASVYNTYVEGHSYKDATIDTMVQGAKDYADGLVGSDIQTLSVTGGESNAAVVRLSKNGGFFTLQGDDTTHITVDPIDEMSIIQIKHNTHEVVAPAPVEVGVDKYGHVAIGNNLQFTDSYAVDNPIATKTYVDTKTHNIEDLTQVDYVIFDANI